MKTGNQQRKFYVLGGLMAGVAMALTAWAVGPAAKTFRTTASFEGLVGGTNNVTSLPDVLRFHFAGWNLVNLARGREFGSTNAPNEVLAMTFNCDLSAASLVVYDRTSQSIVTNIADSTSGDSIQAQNTADPLGRGHVRFVAQFQIHQLGNATNGLLDGFLTVAGRLYTTNDCVTTVLVDTDRKLDHLLDDASVNSKDDRDEVVKSPQAGLAHCIGVIDAVSGGKTNTVLVPSSHLTFRRELVIAP